MTILEQAKPPAEKENYRIKALLVGPSKGGKSSSSCTLPGRKLNVDLDNRGESLVGFEDVQLLREPFIRTKSADPEPWLNLTQLKDDLWELVREEKLTIDSLVIDGLSAMKRIAMDYCMTLSGTGGKKIATSPGGGPSQAHYGPHIHITDQLINQILPLPINIVFTGHVYTFEDELTNKLESWPNVFGRGLRSELGSWFNEVYYCYGSAADGYFWQTGPERKMQFIGSSLNRLQKVWDPTEPIKIDFDRPKTGFADLLERRFKEKAK